MGSSATLHPVDLLTSTPWNLSLPIYRATSTTQRTTRHVSWACMGTELEGFELSPCWVL